LLSLYQAVSQAVLLVDSVQVKHQYELVLVELTVDDKAQDLLLAKIVDYLIVDLLVVP
jgi:hypothetical protein